MTRGPRVDSWTKLNTGDRVTEIDGRHVGRVEAIHHGALVRVKWEGTGWISDIPLDRLVRVERTVHHDRLGTVIIRRGAP